VLTITIYIYFCIANNNIYIIVCNLFFLASNFKTQFTMKIKLVVFGLLCSLFSFAQIQDLAKLANGNIIFNSTMYDNDENIFGYLYLYEQDVNDKNKNIEFVFLDKNLNKVSNGTFPAYSYKGVSSRYYDCTLMGDNIILNKYYYYSNSFTQTSKLLVSTFQTISLSDNKVSAEYKYENAEFVEFTADYETMKSVYKEIDIRNFVNAFSNENFKGFFITEDNKNKGYLEKEVKLFNDKRNLVWKFEYNPNGTKKAYNNFHILYSNKNRIYVSTPKWVQEDDGVKTNTEYNIIALDLQTGKKIYEYVLENKDSEYSHTLRVHQSGNNLILAGNYSPYKKTDFTLNQNLGFYKIVLDENGKEIEKKYTDWSEFAGKIEIDKKGRVEKNYRLKPVKFFFFKNGTISILTEKYKYDILNGSSKTTDFVLFNMTESFVPKSVNTINKEVSYYSGNYLFSQYTKDETGAVFFFYEVGKDPNASIFSNSPTLTLAINTLIDDKLTEEKIQLTAKKKYSIIPYMAKEGYIMLREYNEKDKYNQIRLEKLNY